MTSLVPLALAAALAGCGLSTSGAGTDAAPCSTLAQCNDQNLCTNDRCTESGTCESKAAPDGDPLGQIAGDCKQVTCSGGVEKSTPDDGDHDDGNPCTNDTCKGGIATHDNLPDGDACVLGASKGACVAGTCVVACNGGDQCDDGEPCTSDTCDLAGKKCVFDKTAYDGIMSPDIEDASDDCIDEVCLGGKASAVPDDEELPDDANECTTDSCIDGAVGHAPLSEGSACGSGKYCTGETKCVECLMPSHCGSSPCVDYGCDAAGTCSSTPKQRGAPCNGSGDGVCLGATCVECLTNADCIAPETCGIGGPNSCGCISQPMATTCAGKCGTVVNNCDQNVSCGGCPAGKTCGGGGTPNVCGCSPATCCNGSEDGNETDVDCGGGTCPKCGVGKKCNANADCATNKCNNGQGECM